MRNGRLIKPLIPPAKRGGGKRDGRHARGGQRRDVCAEHRLPVALHPEGPAAAQHGERLLLPVELRRHAGEDPSRALREMPRADRARGQPDRLRHRQPEREKRGKRGPASIRTGYDAGKLIKGKKRHVLVDTLGLLLHALVHPADVQDRDGGVMRPLDLVRTVPFLREAVRRRRLSGTAVRTAVAEVLPHLSVEIVKRSDQAKGFVVLPMRWIVERTLAWLNRCRRLAKDWENLNHNALAFLHLASIRLMLRKLCNPVMNFPDGLLATRAAAAA